MGAATETVALPPVVLEQVDEDPKLLLLGKVDAEVYFSELNREVSDQDDDITTKAGRDRVISRAQSIRKRKAAIDKSRKELTETWRKNTSLVNASGNMIKAKLDAMITEVRAPVTEWEEREAERKAEADALIERLKNACMVTHGTTAAEAEAKLEEIRGLNLNDEVLGPRTEMAQQLKLEAIQALGQIVTDLKSQEARERELEELRQKQAAEEERRQREAAERAQAEAAEAAQKAEKERVEKAAQEAATQAKLVAEQKAEQERRAQQAAAQAEIAAAKRKAEEAERRAREERERVAREERERQAKIEAEAEAQRQREADLAHRDEVQERAAQSLFELPGMTQKLARSVVSQIAAGSVPAVRIEF